MRTVTFKAINGDYKISDIAVAGALGAGGDVAQKVNADGSWGDMYFYMTLEGSGWLEDGWYKDSGGTPVTEDDVLKIGEALFVTSASDITLTVSGQVISGAETIIPVDTGMSMIGNPLPITVTIANIAVAGALGAGGDYAQKVNVDGSWGDMYFYMTLEGSGWLEDGWYKDSGGTPVTSDDLLAPGESLFVTVAADVTLTFPQAL